MSSLLGFIEERSIKKEKYDEWIRILNAESIDTVEDIDNLDMNVLMELKFPALLKSVIVNYKKGKIDVKTEDKIEIYEAREDQNLPLVTWGKYKDKPVTELMKDVKYLGWAKNSGALQKQQPELYQLVVNNIYKPNNAEPTPAHNKMQNKFLEMSYTRKFLSFCFPDADIDAHIPDIINPVNLKVIPEDVYSWDVTIELLDQNVKAPKKTAIMRGEYGKIILPELGRYSENYRNILLEFLRFVETLPDYMLEDNPFKTLCIRIGISKLKPIIGIYKFLYRDYNNYMIKRGRSKMHEKSSSIKELLRENSHGSNFSSEDIDMLRWMGNDSLFGKFLMSNKLEQRINTEEIDLPKDTRLADINTIRHVVEEFENTIPKKLFSNYDGAAKLWETDSMNRSLKISYRDLASYAIAIYEAYKCPNKSKKIRIDEYWYHPEKLLEAINDADFVKFVDKTRIVFVNDKLYERIRDVETDNLQIIEGFSYTESCKQFVVTETEEMIKMCGTIIKNMKDEIKQLMVMDKNKKSFLTLQIEDDFTIYVGYDSMSSLFAKKYLELKPTLGEEYPAVLRQMQNKIALTKTKTYGGVMQCFLVVERYMGITKRETIRDVFGRHDIKIIFLDELDIEYFSLSE